MDKPRYRKISDLLIHPPKLVKNILSDYIWKVDTDRKVIYLTFDDGPIPDVTESVLNLLKTFDAKATFFCVGENVIRNPEIYKRIISEGHSTGNHTFSHLNGAKTDTEHYVENVEKAAEYIQSSLFRPPHGRIKTSQFIELSKKYKIVLWDVLSYDFDLNASPRECYVNIKHFTRPGSIIVMHDSIKAKPNMFCTLINTLKHFTGKGYSFEALTPEILSNNSTANTEFSKIKISV